MYEGVRSKTLYTTKFDDNSDLGTTYLGRIYMTRSDMIKSEKRFSMSEQSCKMGKCLDDTECQIFLNTVARKSFMSITHYLR